MIHMPEPVMRFLVSDHRSVLRLLEFTPIWLLVKVSGLMPLDFRSRVWATLGGILTRSVPPLRNRVERNLAHVMPDLARGERARLVTEIGRNAGRCLSELLFNRQFRQARSRFDVSGPGYDAVEAARGKGCILVSGHFGQWEAVRHVLGARGLTCAAIYRPNNNGYYDGMFLESIRWGGEPMFESGPRGMRKAVRHLRAGGIVSLLADQRYNRGEALDFLGCPALTSTVAADLALRYSVPLVPAYGTRMPDGRIAVEFEPPIAHTGPVEMTQKLNDSLSRRVRAHPEQWYWMHRRWKNAPPPARSSGA